MCAYLVSRILSRVLLQCSVCNSDPDVAVGALELWQHVYSRTVCSYITHTGLFRFRRRILLIVVCRECQLESEDEEV